MAGAAFQNPNPADALLQAHLRRMRITWAGFLVTVPTATAAVFWLPRMRSAAASPVIITLLALAGSLWVAFSAERDARLRLERAKRAFAALGDERRLLRDHWLVFVVVMLRLEVIVVLGLVTAAWGLGPRIAVVFVLLAGLLMGLAWPSKRKAELLVERGRELRRPE
jgi:hypothetical protein